MGMTPSKTSALTSPRAELPLNLQRNACPMLLQDTSPQPITSAHQGSEAASAGIVRDLPRAASITMTTRLDYCGVRRGPKLEYFASNTGDLS